MPTTETENKLGERLTVTVEGAAKLLGIGRTVAYSAVRTGSIPTVRIGKRYLIPIAALERMLAEAGNRGA